MIFLHASLYFRKFTAFVSLNEQFVIETTNTYVHAEKHKHGKLHFIFKFNITSFSDVVNTLIIKICKWKFYI